MNEDAKGCLGAVLVAIVVVVAALGFTWVAQGNDFFLYKMFAPRYEAVRRQTFENTKSYNQGMVQQVQQYHIEWLQADKEHRKALSSIILHETADYDESRLPADEQQWLDSLKTQRGY